MQKLGSSSRARQTNLLREALQSQSESEEREFWFFFCDVEPHLFHRCCKRGFTHCYVVEKLEYIWMMYNPTRVGLNIVLPPCESAHPFPETLHRLDPDMHCVKVITRGNGDSLTYKPKLISCVSTLQYVSGIGYPFWCLTPYQLYTRLVAAKHHNIKTSEVIDVDWKSRS